MPVGALSTLCALALCCHPGSVLGLLGGATGSAVTAFGRFGVGRACRLVATALCAALVSERTTTLRAKTATRLTRRAFAALGKACLRALERRIELATKSAARRRRTIRPRCGGIMTCAGEAAALATVTRVAFAPLKATEAALATVSTLEVAGTETPRPIVTRRAGKAFRPLRTITETATLTAPAVRAFVLYARQTAVARCGIALEAGATTIICSTRCIEARRVFTVTCRGTITAIKRTLATEARATGATSAAAAIAARARGGITLEAAATALTTAEATTKTTVAPTATVAAAPTTKATAITTR